MKNQYFDLQTKDAFQEGFQRFQKSATFERLQSKFRLKPYFERNATLRRLTIVVSYFLNAFSITTAFFFVFTFLQSVIPETLAFLFSFAGLALLEGLKRLTITPFFQRFFQFKQTAFAGLAGIVALACLSAFLSFKGASDAVLALTSKPETIDVNSVRLPLLERIESLETQKNDLSKTSTWKGKYTSSGAKSAQQIDATLASLDAELLRVTQQAEKENKATLEAHIQKTGIEAEYFAGLALVFDLALIIALAWLEYYDFRSLAEFSLHSKAKLEQTHSDRIQTFETNAKAKQHNGHTHERTKVEGFAMRNASNALRTCEHCSTHFTAKTVWQRFCSTNCRTNSWEMKTGKRLKTQKI